MTAEQRHAAFPAVSRALNLVSWLPRERSAHQSRQLRRQWVWTASAKFQSHIKRICVVPRTVSYVSRAAMIRSLVSMRVPIISSFSTSCNKDVNRMLPLEVIERTCTYRTICFRASFAFCKHSCTRSLVCKLSCSVLTSWRKY